MVQEIELSIPQSYADITLKKWLDLQEQMQSYKDDEEAVNAIMLYHLCGLDANWINGLDIDSFNKIMAELNKFLSNTDLPLQRFVKIDGIEYGFEPNLSEMAYGAYVDISKYETLEVDTKWAEIMSILYRPIVRESGALYDIKPYDGNIDGDKFMEVGMDVHFGSLFFLSSLLKDLLNDTQKSLMGELMETDLPLKLKQILAKNGNLTHQLSNYHKEILQK
jgi:hypothetical protein